MASDLFPARVCPRIVQLMQRAVRKGWSFDPVTCSRFLVDPRRIMEQQDVEDDRWGRLDAGKSLGWSGTAHSGRFRRRSARGGLE